MSHELDNGNATLEATRERCARLEKDLALNPAKYKVLTGDRPTGRLHVGHHPNAEDREGARALNPISLACRDLRKLRMPCTSTAKPN